MASDIDLVFGVATGGGADDDSADLILRQLTQIVDEINRTPFKIKFEVDPSTEESFKKLQEQITGIKHGSESIAQSMSASFTDIAASMGKLLDSIKSISSRRGSGAPVLFVKEEIQEEKERVREYLDMVRDMRSDLLQAINQDAGKGGDAKFMSAFGIDALQEVQKELWKSFDSSSDVFKALEDRLEKSTISATINKIFGEAKAQFETFIPYVQRASSIGIMDINKYRDIMNQNIAARENGIFGKNSVHDATSEAIKAEAESVEKLNDEYDKHKSSVEQAAHAESTKASDSAKLSRRGIWRSKQNISISR